MIYKIIDLNEFDTTADLITIFAGTNDWEQNAILDTLGDIILNITSFYGAIGYVIKGMIADF